MKLNGFFIGLCLLLVSSVQANAGILSDFGTWLVGDGDASEFFGAEEGPRPGLYETDSKMFVLGATKVGHNFSNCVSCHSDPYSGNVELNYDAGNTCLDCHQEALGPYNHPVNVMADTLPDDFVLNAQGEVDCFTCHDPHAGEGSAKMLRGAVPGQSSESFCASCHGEDVSNSHYGGVGFAHQKKLTTGGQRGVLDPVTIKCISCHSGNGNAPPAHYNIHGDSTRMLNHTEFQGSHKVGAVYSDFSYGNEEYPTEDYLNPKISLYEGKMGCASCHSPYSENPNLTSMEMKGSAMCLECHKK